MLAAEFPEELVVEILLWLPVKPLLKFRCVSKPWRSLIDSSSFLKSHLSKNRNSTIYVFDRPGRSGSIGLAEVNLTFAAEADSVNSSAGLNFQSLTIPVSSPPDTEVVVSCDGLICLWSSFPKEIVLVNPSTREYRLLPPISKQIFWLEALGIGYDYSAEEYKVVLIPETRRELYIYESKSNTWSKALFGWRESLVRSPTGYVAVKMFPAGLPEELVVEILSRLPVQSLLRFRCVSKPWRSLIDSSSFIKSHLSNNPYSKIYVFDNPSYDADADAEDGYNGVNLTFAEVDLLNCSDQLLFQSLTLPLSASDEVEVVGSCDGLICLSRGFFTEIVLVNPSTREYRLLPPISKRFQCCEVFGMGYDCSADEYKVVLLLPDKRSKVYIYGSKSNTWRQIDVPTEYTSFIDKSYYGCHGMYTHGALHWTMCRSEHRFSIAAFDLVNEKFAVVEYNADLFGNTKHVGLKVAGGKLCLCWSPPLEESEEDHRVIWVMEEYGAKESWSTFASIDKFVEPIAFSTCGRRLLVRGLICYGRFPRGCSIHWYDLDKKSMDMEFTTSKESIFYHVCQQSLIRLERKLG